MQCGFTVLYMSLAYSSRHKSKGMICREPVDRVLSTYEFAMEVAARSAKGAPPPHDPSKAHALSLLHRVLSVVLRWIGFFVPSTPAPPQDNRQGIVRLQVNTREVWPWSFLVPFLEKDIWQRLPKATKVSRTVHSLPIVCPNGMLQPRFSPHLPSLFQCGLI